MHHIVQSAVLQSHVICPSVCPYCPSVMLVDQHYIDWKSWKPNIFALRSQKVIHLFPGEHGEILGRLEVGWEKVACWSTKAEISLNLRNALKYRKNYDGGPIGSQQRSFKWYYPRPPTTSSSPRLGSQPPTKTPISEIAKATHFKFSMHIHRVDQNKSASRKFWKSTLSIGVARESKNFQGTHIIDVVQSSLR